MSPIVSEINLSGCAQIGQPIRYKNNERLGSLVQSPIFMGGTFMSNEDVNVYQAAQLELQLETDQPGVRWSQDFDVLSVLEVDMVLGGDVGPLPPSSTGEEC